ncbi:MAG: succinate dehydrogenase [Chloroflexi bacterium]|nr:succinate dehydrogenase [Chloroflexota bacterium]
MATVARSAERAEPRGTERQDLWWLEPLSIVAALGIFGVYTFLVSTANSAYFADPYLSPMYSPCLSSTCPPSERLFPFTIDFMSLSPAYFIVGLPLAFRITCYYYRRSVYRAFFSSPAACAVPDLRRRYTGETRFPFVLQNVHRYVLYTALVIIAVLWIDAIKAFSFPVTSAVSGSAGDHAARHFGIGLGTVIMVGNTLLLSFYTLGCHALRHIVGGSVDSFHRASIRFRLWSAVTQLNLHHPRWAWLSMFSVGLTDAYIRMVAAGWIADPRILF